MEFVAGPAVHRVLCADCGTPIEPNSANLCINCLRNTSDPAPFRFTILNELNSVDITEGIPKQSAITFCKACERFLSPPSSWQPAQPESRELLAICLRKLKGLSKVRLIDAGFIWTEPHSKRLKVKLTIQKEVLTSTIIQQVFQVEYIVQYAQCPDCTKLAAKNTWKALVQVRQKVPHKRTFLYLEQLILKHGAQKDTISVKEIRDGLDFFYSQRNHAIKMVEFLNSVVPVRSKSSEQLLSTDTHSGVSSYKFTYSVEIAPICKDDLVCLPMKLARSLSNINPLLICIRVGNSIQLMDPSTLQTADVQSAIYWRTPFESLAAVPDLVEFTVLDVEPSGPVRGKHVLADAQVALSGAFRSNAGRNVANDAMDETGDLSQIFHTRTHLGAILQPGDTALGYHLSHSNYNNPEFANLDASRVPDVVLIKKSYPDRRKKSRNRAWRLRSMAIDADPDAAAAATTTNARGVVGRVGGRDQKKVEEDYELFLRDLEEDSEMRGTINLYKAGATGGSGTAGGKQRGVKKQFDMDVDEQPEEDTDAGDDDEAPEIGLDELLDDFDEMTLNEAEDE